MPVRFRAPKENGSVLAEPGFDALSALVEANRGLLDWNRVTLGGRGLRDLRQQAYDEVIHSAREYMNSLGEWVPGSVANRFRDFPPLLVAGHQPELSHPGVWAKNFALNGLARKLNGIPLNLIVDNDTLKSTAIRFPTFSARDPASVHLQALNFDTFAGELPYEDRTVNDAELFRTFADRAAPLWANWGYEPLLRSCWASGGRKPPVKPPSMNVREGLTGGLRPPLAQNIGEAFAALRREREREWGCHNLELPVSRLSQTRAFAHFAKHLLDDLPRFREVYNAAIRAHRAANGIRSANHPAPELAEGEAPFWVRTGDGKRQRATALSDATKLRPRALTLTLFARVCLGDFFIHGIGGGKYDEVTDAIIRDFFGIEPPAYQVLSATLHLPLPGFPSTAHDLRSAERRVRDLKWNPHAVPGVNAALVREHAALTASEPPRGEHAARRDWFRAIQRVKEKLREAAASEVPAAEAEVRRVRSEVEANAILRRRDYPWVLYPEATLRPFLQRFL